MKRQSTVLSTALALFCFLSACSQGKNGNEKKHFGGKLTVGIFFAPSEINPITTDSTISANLLDLIFNTLVRINEDGAISPEIAETWDVSPDGLLWTFHLRREAVFHDGSPLTSEDVKFTLDTIQKTERSGYAYALKNVRQIEAVDPWTLRITFDKADSLLWDSLGVIGIAPKKLLQNDPDFSSFNKHPIGSGPYRFVSQDDKQIVLESNERYFGGRPYLNQIVVKVLASETASINNLIAGNIDMAFLLNPEDYGALSQIRSIRVYDNWYPLLYMVFLNHDNKLFTDPRVRQALNLAIDKQMLIERILKGKGEIAAGTADESHESHNPAVTPYPYKPQEALKLLSQAGWADHDDDFILDKGGRKFEFNAYAVKGEELTSKALRITQQQLGEIGVRMAIKELPFDEYVRVVVRERGFDANLAIMVVRSLYDSNFTYWHSSQIQAGLNFCSYRNAEVDRLLDEARFEVDPARRREAFQQFQKVIHDDPPGIFLFWRNMPVALQARFRDVPEKRMESLRDLVKVWAAPTP
ncbi:MAG TPA: ABC transporter substrate-binding protein [bacterium]|nr:ABC transporter substrate-binding protein [bacterium]